MGCYRCCYIKHTILSFLGQWSIKMYYSPRYITSYCGLLWFGSSRFTNNHQSYFTCTRVKLPQCLWSNPDEYGHISHWIYENHQHNYNTTKHRKHQVAAHQWLLARWYHNVSVRFHVMTSWCFIVNVCGLVPMDFISILHGDWETCKIAPVQLKESWKNMINFYTTGHEYYSYDNMHAYYFFRARVIIAGSQNTS